MSTGARCAACTQRLSLLGFRCSRCGQCLCARHRLPEDHACDAAGVRAEAERGREALRLALLAGCTPDGRNLQRL